MDTEIISSPDLMKKPRGKVQKRSRIWEIFTVSEQDRCKAICNECQCIVSRGGGTARSQCTTNLWNHVKNKHPQIYEQIKALKEEVTRNSPLPPPPENKIEQHENTEISNLFAVNADNNTEVKCMECDMKIVKSEDDNGTDALMYHMLTCHPTSYATFVNDAIENAVLNSKGRRSEVWNEFTQHPLDSCKVVCNTCDTIVSRGCAKERLNTTNMRRHLRGHHHLNALNSKGLFQRHLAYLEREENELEYNQSPKHNLQNARNEVMEKYVNSQIKTNQINASPNVDTSRSDEEMSGNNTDSSSDCDNFPKMGDVGKMMTNRQVDMVHTGLLMNALYQQQQRNICCDFFIFVRKSSITRKQNSGEKQDDSDTNNTHSTTEFKLHKCVAGTVSDKLQTVIESGSDQFTIKGVDEDAMNAFIEIIYTGKLDTINCLKRVQLQNIYKIAKMLSTPSVLQYLERSFPNVFAKTKIADSPVANGQDNFNFAQDYQETFDDHVNVDTSHLVPHIRKVNKRKNYLPMANESMRKRHKMNEMEDIVNNLQSSQSPSRNEPNESLHTSNIDENTKVHTTNIDENTKDCVISPKSLQETENVYVPSSSGSKDSMDTKSATSTLQYFAELIKSDEPIPDGCSG